MGYWRISLYFKPPVLYSIAWILKHTGRGGNPGPVVRLPVAAQWKMSGIKSAMYVLFIQLEPDIDHMAPIAYRLAREHPGRVEMVCTNAVWDIDNDYRIKFLRAECGVRVDYIHKVFEGSFLPLRIMRCLLRLPGLILRLVPDAAWKAFYFRITGRVIRPAAAGNHFQAVNARCIIVDEAQPKDNLSAIHAAAQSLDVPVVMIQTANGVLKKKEGSGPISFTGADYMILPNNLASWYRVDAPGIRILGCMRYCAGWQETNSRLVERAYPGKELPDEPGKLKVLILGRFTKNFLKNHDTVRRVAGLRFVSCIFKSRPRVLAPRKVYELNDFNIYPSARLIQWADVVVCSITSVALDVLYYGKTLIYAKYLAPDESATFEDFGACWMVNSEEELAQALAAIHQDRACRSYGSDEINRFFSHAIYAGNQHSEVLAGYVEFLDSTGRRNSCL